MEENVNLTWQQGKSIDLVMKKGAKTPTASVKNCQELRDMFNVNFYFIIVANLKPQQSYPAYRQDNNNYFESLTACFRTF